MRETFLTKNTTKEQREQIIRNSLSVCGGACDGCSSCDDLGGGNPWEMYQPYIDDVKELDEINMEYHARYFKQI